MTEIKNDKSMESSPYWQIGRINIVKMSPLPEVIEKYNRMPRKFQSHFSQKYKNF